jgi:hypothetical protein
MQPQWVVTPGKQTTTTAMFYKGCHYLLSVTKYKLHAKVKQHSALFK